MRYPDLIDDLERSAPFVDRSAAERALEATLRTLALASPVHLARDIAAALPRELAPWLSADPLSGSLDAAGFDAQVARFAGLSRAAATERAEVICERIASWLEPELRARVERALAPELASRFAQRPHTAAPAPHVPHREQAHTLASGRPGGTHPIASSSAGSTHPVHSSRPLGAHTGSVASEQNPHADSKLSSAHGTTQEREHETLADGKPAR